MLAILVVYLVDVKDVAGQLELGISGVHVAQHLLDLTIGEYGRHGSTGRVLAALYLVNQLHHRVGSPKLHRTLLLLLMRLFAAYLLIVAAYVSLTRCERFIFGVLVAVRDGVGGGGDRDLIGTQLDEVVVTRVGDDRGRCSRAIEVAERVAPEKAVLGQRRVVNLAQDVRLQIVHADDGESRHNVVADHNAHHERFRVVGQCLGDEAARRTVGDAAHVRIRSPQLACQNHSRAGTQAVSCD